MKAYKGFNKDMTCRGFQFEEGKTYQEDTAILCGSGFHACENPLDCFRYYAPADSVYHEVELDEVDEARSEEDSKRCGKIIKIGANLDIIGIVKATFDFVYKKSKEPATGEESNAAAAGYKSNAATAGYGSNAAATGEESNAAAAGDWSNAAATGYKSNAATAGYGSNAAAAGYRSNAATAGDWGNAAATGEESNATAAGDWSNAAAAGYRSNAATAGNGSNAAAAGEESNATANNKNSVAIATGKNAKARGVKGAYIVLTEWSCDATEILSAKMTQVDGEKIKADTWYKLENSEFVEVSEDE